MDGEDSHGSHVAKVIMRADLRHKVRVSTFGSTIEVHHTTQEDDGHWLTSIVLDATIPPIGIRGPRFVFVPHSSNRYGAPSRTDVPDAHARAGRSLYAQLVALRDDGLFMTPSEVRDMMGALRNLVTTLREEGYDDVSRRASRAASQLARHDPALPVEFAPWFTPSLSAP